MYKIHLNYFIKLWEFVEIYFLSELYTAGVIIKLLSDSFPLVYTIPLLLTKKKKIRFYKKKIRLKYAWYAFEIFLMKNVLL